MNVSTGYNLYRVKLYRGFNSNVVETNHWFTVSRQVDLTPAIYGKPSFIKQKAINIIKFLKTINSIRKLINLIKFLNPLKLPRLIFVTIPKLAFNGIKLSAKFIIRGLGKFIILIAKGLLLPFKLLYSGIKLLKEKWIKTVWPKLKEKIKILAERFKDGIKRFIQALKDFYHGPLKDFLKRSANAAKEWIRRKYRRMILRLFGKKKGKAILTKPGKIIWYTKTFAANIKQGVTQMIAKGGEMLVTVKTKTGEVVSKIGGIGGKIDEIWGATKHGALRLGKEYILGMSDNGKGQLKGGWYRNLKAGVLKKQRVMQQFLKNNKAVKFVIGLSKWLRKHAAPAMVKLVNLLKTVGRKLFSIIFSTVATAISGPTFGVSILIAFMLGLVFEGLNLWGFGGNYWSKIANGGGWKAWLQYLWDAACWAIPGAGAIKAVGITASIVKFGLSLARLFAPLVPDLAILIWGKEKEYNEFLKEHNDVLSGNDVIFNKSKAELLETAKDMEKTALTQQILKAKLFAKKCDDTIINIITTLHNHQINRTNVIENITKSIV